MRGQAEARARLLGLAEDGAARAVRIEAQRGRFARIAGRHENGTAPVAVESFQLFPTPAPIAAQMAEIATRDAPAGARYLEPSAGTGNLVRALEAQGVPRAQIRAVELSEAVAAECSLDFPGLEITTGDFLAQSADSLGMFDRVVMNPPFRRGLDARHALHAARMLRPGGLLVGLCYDGAAWRNTLAPLVAARGGEVERLPPGSFREAGTDAGVVLYTLPAV